LIGTAGRIGNWRKDRLAGTFAMFLMRGWEQIRNTVAHDNLNVKLLGSHSGLTNSKDGGSHQCLEDIALMSCLPNMSILNPVDAIEAEKIVINEVYRKGPSYIRMNRLTPRRSIRKTMSLEFGKAVEIREGEDLTIIATGTMVSEAVKAAEMLKKENINARVLNVHTIKPIDKSSILKSAKETGHIITIEEHNIYGGLGSAVAGLIVENYPVPMKIMGVNDEFGESGDYNYLINKFGLNDVEIVKKCKETYW